MSIVPPASRAPPLLDSAPSWAGAVAPHVEQAIGSSEVACASREYCGRGARVPDARLIQVLVEPTLSVAARLEPSISWGQRRCPVGSMATISTPSAAARARRGRAALEAPDSTIRAGAVAPSPSPEAQHCESRAIRRRRDVDQRRRTPSPSAGARLHGQCNIVTPWRLTPKHSLPSTAAARAHSVLERLATTRRWLRGAR